MTNLNPLAGLHQAAYGPNGKNSSKDIDRESFEGAYSAFVLNSPSLCKLNSAPLRVLGTSTSKRRMFDTSNEGILDVGLECYQVTKWLVRFLEGDFRGWYGGRVGFWWRFSTNPTGYPLWHFFRGLKTQQSDLSKNWVNAYEERVRS